MSSDSKNRYAALVEQFGGGWAKADTERILAVFSPDALFFASPFDPPARGAEAIRTYWRDLPREQAEIAFRFGEIFVAGPWFSAEFKCTFRRRRTGEPVDLRGALFCETDGERITEMRMYWHRQVSQRT